MFADNDDDDQETGLCLSLFYMANRMKQIEVGGAPLEVGARWRHVLSLRLLVRREKRAENQIVHLIETSSRLIDVSIKLAAE